MAKVHCQKCGKITRYQDGFCQSCRRTTAPATAGANPKGEKKMKNEKKHYNIGDIIITTLFGLLITAAIVAIVFLTLKIIATTPKAAAIIPASVTDTTDATTAAGNNSSNYQVGEPADASDINNGVWNQPYADAIMVGTDGTTSVYTQSGKDGSTTLSGKIPANVALVVDSYNLTVNRDPYTNGNLLVIVNDGKTEKDIINYGISYTNGCAQLISVSNLQTLLDENIAVKFARGDWDKDTNKWSYSPWALENLWIPTGYTYNPLTLTYVTDTYPNKDNATDTSVNTSGAN